MNYCTPIALAAAALLTCASASAADWSSNAFSYRYAPSQSEPGASDQVAKNIINFSHVSGDKLGSNLFSIDFLRSNNADPSNSGVEGATEWFGFYQRSFSMKAMTGNTTGYGFAKDLKLTGRIDAGTKNTGFAPAPFKVKLGVAAAMPLSAGFWDIGVEIVKETNNNGISKKAVNFDAAPAFVSAWAVPMGGIGALSGFASIVGPKGKDGFGAETVTETLIRTQFMFNVLGSSSGLTAGVGVEYWNNKFGCDNSKSRISNACTATTPLLLVEYKL